MVGTASKGIMEMLETIYMPIGDLSCRPSTEEQNQSHRPSTEEQKSPIQLIAQLPVDVVVAADGSGDYTTLTAAIAAAPLKSDKRHVIHIKRGVYKEFVVAGADVWNLVLVGDGMDATVISGSRCYADGFTTPQTAVLAVLGRGFVARDLCVENTAGPKKEGGQAVALFSDSEESVLYRCALQSYQDTLYAGAGKQFYRECKISGTVDFIFGDAAAVFQSCDILARLPIQGQQNTVTAQGRYKPDSTGGFCFQDCTVAADEDLAHAKGGVETYLGRPWKPYSRVVFMQCTISDVLDAKGGLPWEHAAPPDTIYYAEYDNDGPGAAVGARVNWPGFHAIRDAAEVINFTVEKFINGNDWLPSTGVDYKPGL